MAAVFLADGESNLVAVVAAEIAWIGADDGSNQEIAHAVHAFLGSTRRARASPTAASSLAASAFRRSRPAIVRW